MGEPGRPTDLTSELLSSIREGLLAGKTQESIKEELGIPNSTWCRWFYDNYNGFRDSVETWRLARKVKVAEEFSDRLMDIAEDDKEILKLKQKEAEFLRETIGKKVYSKRSELTGGDGKDLPSPIIAIQRDVPTNNSIQQDKPTE